MTVGERIAAERLVAIFRGDYRGKWTDYAIALIDGGVSILEVTLNSPGALEAISDLKRYFSDEITIGAGTVLSADKVDAAVAAGAQFIVAPDTDPAVIAAAKTRGAFMIPGAYTATEVKLAHLLGADMVKLFPAQTPEYLTLIHAPLDHIPLMVTGGVTADNAREYIRRGAKAVGVGNYLTSLTISLGEVRTRAESMRAVLGIGS